MSDKSEGTSGVYKITNQVNGKIYIGSSKNIKGRWRRHKSALRNDKHGNPHLQNAFNKYGSDNFEFAIVEKIVNVEDLIDREQHYMDTLKPKYNIRPKANWSEMSEETKRKLSKANKGKKLSEKTKKKLSKANKGIEITWGKKISKANQGHKVSKETRQKISKANSGKNNGNYGKQFTEETRQKMSKASRGENHPQSKLTKKRVKIIKHLLDGDSFTQKEIGKMFGVIKSTICNINNKRSWSHIEVKN